MKYLLFILLIFFLIFSFFNFGKYIDISMKPKQVDIVVSLNEGIERVNKSLEVIKQGYVKKNILLLTYKRKTHIDYILKKIPTIHLVFTSKPFNTAEEIRFIKQYMLKHHYTSAMIISDPPHTRRIEILTKLIHIKGDDMLKFIIVGSNVKWWNAKSFYKSKKSFRFVVTELLKIPYTYIWYGGIEKIGIKWNIDTYKEVKSVFNKIIFNFMNILGFKS